MKRPLVVLGILISIGILLLVWLNFRDEDMHPSTTADADPATLVTRGAYLARAGNCAACHTAPGGERYAGGRGLPTPFGTVYATNLTPDTETGIGAWSEDDFWRALHNGRARDGRFLYPAFPYPNYTRVTRADADALYAYLRTVPPVQRANRAHTLRFPYNTQIVLAGWRALFFRPGVYAPQSDQTDEWNRGAYLVNGLGHCGACHAGRNALGAAGEELRGGLMPLQGWYAPSLHAPHEASLAGWDPAHAIALLKNGVAPGASVLGPMAEVVYGSTQYLAEQDLRAMATYLAALPPHDNDRPKAGRVEPGIYARGEKLYTEHCADCHGENGEGADGKYPALAGNRAVTITPAVNIIRAVLNGGYTPSTAGNPRPYGMPPFAPFLDDMDTAAVVSYIRNAWGNEAPPVSVWEVEQFGRGTAAK